MPSTSRAAVAAVPDTPDLPDTPGLLVVGREVRQSLPLVDIATRWHVALVESHEAETDLIRREVRRLGDAADRLVERRPARPCRRGTAVVEDLAGGYCPETDLVTVLDQQLHLAG